MAVDAFWNVFELKMNVFLCLDDDRRFGDLARCARVHRSWTNLALDVLWHGDSASMTLADGLSLGMKYKVETHRRGDCRNWYMPVAIIKFPFARRQRYASRMSVLDLHLEIKTLYPGFDELEFPRLKDLKVFNHHGFDPDLNQHQFLRYLHPTLEHITARDESEYRADLLTGSFLNKLAERCPGLKRVNFRAQECHLDPDDLAQLFKRIRPCEVKLEHSGPSVLTYEVLSALAHGGRLETLITERRWEEEEPESDHMKRLCCESTAATESLFPKLTFLAISLSGAGIPWAAKCFSAVTSLRVFIRYTEDESVLVPISTMSQLRVLHIVGDCRYHTIPARAFVALSSLSRLTGLWIHSSFRLCYDPRDEPADRITDQPEADEEAEEELYFPSDIFTEADAADMFSGLASLAELSLDAGAKRFPDYLLKSISQHCPSLRLIEFVGELPLRHFTGQKSPVFNQLREMRFDHIWNHFRDHGVPSVSTSRLVKMITDVAPGLEALVSKCWDHNDCYMRHACLAFEESLRGDVESPPEKHKD